MADDEHAGQAATTKTQAPTSSASTQTKAADQQPVLRRTGDQVDRLLVAVGLRGQLDAEAVELSHLLEHKLAHEVPGDDERATDALQVRCAFLRHRFTQPVMDYESADRFYSYLDTSFNLVSIIAGVGASLAAALDAPKGITIALGLIVAFLQTLSQWLKPSQRAARRGRAASELRGEAWDLLQGRDRYRGKDLETAWDIFCDQVDKVEDREDAEEDRESAQSPAAARSEA